MKEITLRLKGELKVPLDLSKITDKEGGIPEKNVLMEERLQYGNKRVPVKDLFEIEEREIEGLNGFTLLLKGNFAKARRIGFRLKGGSVLVEGPAGLYLGEEMFQGHIKVVGDAGSWLGSKMNGGTIEVTGDAGDFIGSSYRGSREGMKGGTIMVNGSIGDEAGCWMRGGVIHVRGSAGMFPGVHMRGGNILVEGSCAGRAGAQMTAGVIVIKGRVSGVLPSFTFQDLKKNAKMMGEKIMGPFYLFSGDVNENGIGKLYLSKENNPHLRWNERYLEVLE